MTPSSSTAKAPAKKKAKKGAKKAKGPKVITLPEHTVEVVDGQSEPIELTTGSADLLEQNGFSLRTDESGRLEVASVDEDGSAHANGLREGDRVEGLTPGGVDVAELLPGMSDDITDAVLDRWGGPGVGLIVDRDGERVQVDLD